MVRTILALLAFWAVYLAERRYFAFKRDMAWNFRYDVWLWLSWIGCSAAAGLLFGLAVWLPFTRVRYLWSRLLLVALAALPVADWWLVWNGKVHGWLASTWLIRDTGPQFAFAVLEGVAIASGFVAKDSKTIGPAG